MGPGPLLTLSSTEVEVVVAPDLGARIVELTDLSVGRQWLWRNRRVPLGAPSPGAAYDDVWVGGFEELFPNDAAGEVAGRSLPDHGELWSRAWEVLGSDPTATTMRTTAPVSGCTITKTLGVAGHRVSIAYEIAAGDATLPYLFKLHPALAIDGDCTIDLPGGMVEQVVPGFGSMLGEADHVPWPGPPGVALDRCRPSESGDNEFVYVSDLPAGWCGVTDGRLGRSIRIGFDRSAFPYCWIFMTYGGWRGHDVVVLEPCTTHPKDLVVASERGTTPTLAAGQTVRYEVVIEVLPAS